MCFDLFRFLRKKVKNESSGNVIQEEPVKEEMNPSEDDCIYLEYESTIYCYYQNSGDLFYMGASHSKISNGSQYSRIVNNGSVISKEEAIL